MPSTSPIAHPVKQCSVADAATDHGTDANPVGPAWCSCPRVVSVVMLTSASSYPWGVYLEGSTPGRLVKCVPRALRPQVAPSTWPERGGGLLPAGVTCRHVPATCVFVLVPPGHNGPAYRALPGDSLRVCSVKPHRGWRTSRRPRAARPRAGPGVALGATSGRPHHVRPSADIGGGPRQLRVAGNHSSRQEFVSRSVSRAGGRSKITDFTLRTGACRGAVTAAAGRREGRCRCCSAQL